MKKVSTLLPIIIAGVLASTSVFAFGYVDYNETEGFILNQPIQLVRENFKKIVVDTIVSRGALEFTTGTFQTIFSDSSQEPEFIINTADSEALFQLIGDSLGIGRAADDQVGLNLNWDIKINPAGAALSDPLIVSASNASATRIISNPGAISFRNDGTEVARLTTDGNLFVYNNAYNNNEYLFTKPEVDALDIRINPVEPNEYTWDRITHDASLDDGDNDTNHPLFALTAPRSLYGVVNDQTVDGVLYKSPSGMPTTGSYRYGHRFLVDERIETRTFTRSFINNAQEAELAFFLNALAGEPNGAFENPRREYGTTSLCYLSRVVVGGADAEGERLGCWVEANDEGRWILRASADPSRNSYGKSECEALCISSIYDHPAP